MKKFLLTILTLIYMTVSSGVAMEIHYCMGKRAGVDLYNTADEKCGRCGMKEKKGGCCNDEHVFYKLADAHKNVYNDYNAFVSPVIIVNDLISFSADIFYPVNTKNILKAPPGNYGPPLFVKNCVFRI